MCQEIIDHYQCLISFVLLLFLKSMHLMIFYQGFFLSFSTSGLINKRKGQSVQKLYKKGIILLFSYGVVYFLIFWHMISVFNVLQHTKQYKNRTHLWMLFSACQGQNLGKVLKHFCRFEFCFFLAFHKLKDWSIYDRDRSVWRSPWN